MDRKQAIDSLRKVLAEDDISAMIIPSNDPHFGEYIPDYYKTRAWLSGFTGSAGTLVITMEKAALWTDSRYFIQAEKELKGTDIELMRLKMEGTPSIPEWLKANLEDESIVAIDENLYSYADYTAYVDALAPLTPTLIEDPFSKIWKGRPPLEFNPIRFVPDDISGESISSKHHRLCEKLSGPIPFVYIITVLDEIAWLLNLRGTDVEYNPLFLSYAIVTPDKIRVFLRQQLLSPEAMSNLCKNGVEIDDYENFTDELKLIPPQLVRIFSSEHISAKNFLAAMENIYQPPVFAPYISDPTVGGTLAMMKAIKNEVEIEGFRKAYAQDAIAWEKIIAYIQEHKNDGINEFQISQKLIEYRSECPDYLGESFEPIVAYGPNAALPHYSATSPEDASVIRPEGFLLIDTGAHYTFGTTDTTRTIPLGPITEEMRDDYTRVLKGMLDMTMAKFIKGMRGCLLDIIARGPIINSGKMYWHGTCHGIGHNLCVHEGPQSIRMEENPVAMAAGMVISNEPAVYVPGQYGIRHENTLLTVPFVANEYGEFFGFETLTDVPIERSAINFDLLTRDEISLLEKMK